jgi:hypothetical protein
MTERFAPSRWANRVTRILNAVLGDERFPVKVAEVAKELSAQLFADDPISLVKGASLPGFEGALYPDPAGKRGARLSRSSSRPCKLTSTSSPHPRYSHSLPRAKLPTFEGKLPALSSESHAPLPSGVTDVSTKTFAVPRISATSVFP